MNIRQLLICPIIVQVSDIVEGEKVRICLAINPICGLLERNHSLQLLFFFLGLDFAFDVLLRAHVHVQLILDLTYFGDEIALSFSRVQLDDGNLGDDCFDLDVFKREGFVRVLLFE